MVFRLKSLYLRLLSGVPPFVQHTGAEPLCSQSLFGLPQHGLHAGAEASLVKDLEEVVTVELPEPLRLPCKIPLC